MQHVVNWQTKIKNDEKGYWIGMGDYADCILKDDKRFDIQGLAVHVHRTPLTFHFAKLLLA